MQLQARPLAGQALAAEPLRLPAPARALPIRARRSVAPRAADGAATGLSSNSSLLGPSLNSSSSSLGPKPPGSAPAKAAVSLSDVPLESGVGVDYTALRDLLAAANWREAEDETRAKLIQAAGPGAELRSWVYWSEVKSIPESDMRTLDALWAAASNGRFGYKVQRDIWVQNRRQWTKFFKAIDWVQGENNVYRKWPSEFKYVADAPKGHLPLTNALRGTRLFEAIMEHPAIAVPAAGGNGSGAGKPDWLK
jgi:hypothetical protein